jgi:hypothetical protein
MGVWTALQERLQAREQLEQLEELLDLYLKFSG